MSYNINYNKEQDYIVVTVEGEFTLSTIKVLAADVANFVDRYNCNHILNDLRHARLTEETIDIYNMPKNARQFGAGSYLRRALVVIELTSNFRFLETVFINQGHIVKLFTKMEDALHWLLNKEKSI
ncbi:MAG: hypothetical protein PVJ21_18325 [Anaerolineales bacterium]|jgi:hypothetical protein